MIVVRDSHVVRRVMMVLVAALASLIPLADGAAQAAGDDAESVEFVLLASNIATVPPEAVSDATRIVDRVLAAQMTERGHRFVQLSLVDGIKGWTDAIERIGGIAYAKDGSAEESVEEARQAFLAELVREFPAARVIWPDLAIRTGKFRDGKVRWDGVTRPMYHETGRYRSSGRTLCTSLRLRLYSAQGAILVDRYRGLERVLEYYEIHVFDEIVGVATRWRNRVRPDLLEDEALIEREARHLLRKTLD